MIILWITCYYILLHKPVSNIASNFRSSSFFKLGTINILFPLLWYLWAWWSLLELVCRMLKKLVAVHNEHALWNTNSALDICDMVCIDWRMYYKGSRNHHHNNNKYILAHIYYTSRTSVNNFKLLWLTYNVYNFVIHLLKYGTRFIFPLTDNALFTMSFISHKHKNLSSQVFSQSIFETNNASYYFRANWQRFR